MPFVVVEVVMEDELEVIGCVEWEWEIYDVVSCDKLRGAANKL